MKYWLAAVVVGMAGSQSVTARVNEPVGSLDIVESTAFLERYREASAAQDPSFYDLYSDGAVIHARIEPQPTGIAFQGRTYKAWGRELLQSGKAALDGSEFRDATVEQRGKRLIVRARRYSTTRCYWDLTYAVAIEKEAERYRIVDERLTTNPTARCSAPATSPNPGVSEPLHAARGLPAQTPASPWHPLSSAELADKAVEIAKVIEAARRDNVNPAYRQTPSRNGTDTLEHSPEARPVVAVERNTSPSDLRITPSE